MNDRTTIHHQQNANKTLEIVFLRSVFFLSILILLAAKLCLAFVFDDVLGALGAHGMCLGVRARCACIYLDRHNGCDGSNYVPERLFNEVRSRDGARDENTKQIAIKGIK